MDNAITPDTPESIAAEKAAVAMLLSAAAEAQAQAPAQSVEVPTAPESSPAENIDDLQSLFEAQKKIGNELAALKQRAVELNDALAKVKEQSVELQRQSESLRERAARLFDTTFGVSTAPKVEQPAPAPPPAAQRKPKPLDNSVVWDKSVGSGTPGAPTPDEFDVVAGIPSMQF